MKGGNTYKENCIVPREDLRYLLVLHKDKEGNTHQGEMVVHKLIAEDVLEIFEKLYDAGAVVVHLGHDHVDVAEGADVLRLDALEH